jgi:hypothetical protein
VRINASGALAVPQSVVMYGGVELASRALGAVLYGLEHVDDMGELADMKYRTQLRQQVEQSTLFGTYRKPSAQLVSLFSI